MLTPAYREAGEKLYSSLTSAPRPSFRVVEATRISGALYLLSKSTPISAHQEIIQNVYLNQRFSILEMRCMRELTPGLDMVGLPPDPHHPAVFCSFHVGAYRLVLPWLLAQGHKVSMLIDFRVMATIGKEIDETVTDFCRNRDISIGSFKVRDTSDPNMLRHLMRDIQAGYSLLLFMDGNTGIGMDSKNLVPISFMAHTLRVRTGVLHVAKRCNTPLIPILMRPRINRGGLLYPGAVEVAAAINVDRLGDGWLLESAHQVWRHLEHRLTATLDDWESWRYIDASIQLSANSEGDESGREIILKDEQRFSFNEDRFILYTDANRKAVFDRAKLLTFFISDAFASFLEKCKGKGIAERELIDQKQIDSLSPLLQRGILKIID